MNPESNRWENMPDIKAAREFIDKHYKNKKDSGIPIFKKGEVIRLRGYNWRVHGLHKGGSRLILRAMRKAE